MSVAVKLECGTGHSRTMRCLSCCSYAPVSVPADAYQAWCAMWSASNVPVVSAQAFNASTKSLTFGQCDLALFVHIMHRIASSAEEDEGFREWTFVDLGSGMGRMVFAAHLLFSFRQSVGIEIVPELHAIAEAKLEEFLRKQAEAGVEGQEDRIKFILGDMLAEHWEGEQEGKRESKRVIFITGTCFTEELFEQAVRKAGRGMVAGGWLVSFTKEVPSAWGLPFVLCHQFSRVKVDWGAVSVFIYKKEL